MYIAKSMNVRRGNQFYTLKYKEFVLGEVYYLQWFNALPMRCKFIQVTQYGYNFLNEDTNVCVLSKHLYVPKKLRNYLDNDTKILYIWQDLNILSPEVAKQETEIYHIRNGLPFPSEYDKMKKVAEELRVLSVKLNIPIITGAQHTKTKI